MAVTAYKIIALPSEHTVQREWECGTFDLMNDTDPGNGWVELSRDCDAWRQQRRTLVPFASGNNGLGQVTNPYIPAMLRFYKPFIAAENEIITELDLSDINGGVLPSDLCAYFDLSQNGKEIPCTALTADYGTSIVAIDPLWQVMGANYYVKFWASPYMP